MRMLILLAGLLVSIATLALTAELHLPRPSLLAKLTAAGLAALTMTWLVGRLGNFAGIMAAAAESAEGAERLRQDMAIGMSNEAAYVQLIELYEPIRAAANASMEDGRGFEPVTRQTENGAPQRYAALALPAAGCDSLDGLLDSPISDFDRTHLRGLADSRQRLMRKWREIGESAGRTLEDEMGENYCLTKLAIDGASEHPTLRLEVGVASYGEIVRSCDALINEFALFAFLSGPITNRSPRPRRRTLRMSPAAMLCCLPWRRRSHRKANAGPGDLLLNPIDRAAGLGVAVVTVEEEFDDLRVFLGMRSGIVGTYPSTNHVVPAGMCNTYGTDLAARAGNESPPAEYLRTAMKCEFIEEWFSAKEFEDNRRPGWQRLVESRWQQEMETKADRWKEPRFTGIAFDLLNLRPEVCAMAVVKAKDTVLNWEFDSIGFEGPLASVGAIPPTKIVQSGAAALWLLDRNLATEDGGMRAP